MQRVWCLAELVEVCEEAGHVPTWRYMLGGVVFRMTH